MLFKYLIDCVKKHYNLSELGKFLLNAAWTQYSRWSVIQSVQKRRICKKSGGSKSVKTQRLALHQHSLPPSGQSFNKQRNDFVIKLIWFEIQEIISWYKLWQKSTAWLHLVFLAWMIMITWSWWHFNKSTQRQLFCWFYQVFRNQWLLYIHI